MICTKCKNDKEPHLFVKDKRRKTGLSSWCRECHNKGISDSYKNKPEIRKASITRCKTWTAANKERVKEYQKRWGKENPDKIKSNLMKYRYGVDLNWFEATLISQKNRCAICDTAKDECPRGLLVDHNHITGKARGLICDDCNKAIAFLRDSSARAKKAAAYLDYHDGRT